RGGVGCDPPPRGSTTSPLRGSRVGAPKSFTKGRGPKTGRRVMSVLKRLLGKSTKLSRKAVASARRQAVKPAVEALEIREVPAGISYNPFSHVLTVAGDAGNDTIAITRNGGN